MSDQAVPPFALHRLRPRGVPNRAEDVAVRVCGGCLMKFPATGEMARSPCPTCPRCLETPNR